MPSWKTVASIFLLTIIIVNVRELIAIESASNIEYTVPEADVPPDSPFYEIHRFLENLHLMIGGFTGGDTERVRILMKHAGERLAEIRLLVYENKTRTDLILRLDNDYTGEVEESLRIAIAGNRTALIEHVAMATAKHLAVLEAVASWVPENARGAIQNALNASTHGHEQAIQSLSKHLSPAQLSELKQKTQSAKKAQQEEEEERKKKKK